jgi:hypothetical protein
MANDRSNPTDGTAQQEEEKEAQNNEEREAPPCPLLDQGFCQETLVVEEEGEETNDQVSQLSEAAFVNKGTSIYSMRLLLDTRCFFPLTFSFYYHLYIGFQKWQETRATWLASHSSNPNHGAVALQVDGIIDVIFSQKWRTQNQESLFPQPVPLPQMVDILVDLWEAEGLDI